MKRPPQLSLRLDAAPPPATDATWRAHGTIMYLGAALTLKLDTFCRLPERVGNELHLPLPPAATPRQIRDTAESWLRDEAQRQFRKSAPAGRRIVLVFGKRGDWARLEGDTLRCHWRLIEQPQDVIEQVLARVWAEAVAVPRCDDLFALG